MAYSFMALTFGLVPLMADRVEIIRSFWLVMHGDLRKLARIAAVADWLQERIDTLSGYRDFRAAG